MGGRIDRPVSSLVGTPVSSPAEHFGTRRIVGRPF
jgi:hypothetical protein